jgi:hypothetical protein
MVQQASLLVLMVYCDVNLLHKSSSKYVESIETAQRHRTSSEC